MTDIKPTMTDEQVMRFIGDGYIVLEGIIPDEINRQCEFLSGGRLTDFARTDTFQNTVFLHPEVAGVIRSLLGPDFLVPVNAHHHLYEQPHRGQTWHTDGLTEQGYGIYHLQCYYYPQPVQIEDGPTMILPGSQFRLVDREAIAHYGDIFGQKSLTVPAGTVALTRYGIWHKAGPKLNNRRRGMIKFSYFRTADPTRDWLIDSDDLPEFVHQPRQAYATEVESYRDISRCKRTWRWMCGQKDTPSDIAHGAKIFVRARPLKEAEG